MLAKRRLLKLGGDLDRKTPILLPSFSSKGFPKIKKILEVMEEYIYEEILVSAYDVHFGLVDPPFDFATTIFLDSGGYEASKDAELSETFDKTHIPNNWSPDLYSSVVETWESTSPTVFVSFDSPKYRATISEQISRARNLKLPAGNHAKCLLIKPETEASIRLRLSTIIPEIRNMSGFEIIGVTEKEVGNSILNRMINIARIRQELDRHHVDIPIHVFGSLDTITTYLYFVAGADIFDGLTWLRYAFFDDDTIYRHAFGARKELFNTNSDIVEAMCWSNNYHHMQTMRLNMIKFLADKDFGHFGKHSDIIKSAFQSMNAELVGD